MNRDKAVGKILEARSCLYQVGYQSKLILASTKYLTEALKELED